ncbi:MAG: hypothetical protein J5525_11020 [Lachnospiraceae bacterium]|nr:hypothetical protein [Lachnospiraceae bacterium]
MSLSSIKSFQNGIALHLDPKADFEDVIADIETRFEESRKFFKNAKMALSIEDRVVSEEEEKRIVSAINDHSDINLICIVGKNEETNRKYVKALKRVESESVENNTRLYVGNIGEGDIVESEKNLVVYGNVEMGGAAAAKGDVIVFGNILGQVYAGMSGDVNSVVICLGANPMTVSIANVKFNDKIKQGFGKKVKFAPTIFKNTLDKVICEPLSEESLRDLYTMKNVKTV